MRKKRGLVQAHDDLPKQAVTVPGNITRTRMVVRPEPPAFAGRLSVPRRFSLERR